MTTTERPQADDLIPAAAKACWAECTSQGPDKNAFVKFEFKRLEDAQHFYRLFVHLAAQVAREPG